MNLERTLKPWETVVVGLGLVALGAGGAFMLMHGKPDAEPKNEATQVQQQTPVQESHTQPVSLESDDASSLTYVSTPVDSGRSNEIARMLDEQSRMLDEQARRKLVIDLRDLASKRATAVVDSRKAMSAIAKNPLAHIFDEELRTINRCMDEVESIVTEAYEMADAIEAGGPMPDEQWAKRLDDRCKLASQTIDQETARIQASLRRYQLQSGR